MKKIVFTLATVLALASCGGSSETKVEATYDSVGVDSSNILPALTDSAKADTVKVIAPEQ
jgi:hypothetical protein